MRSITNGQNYMESLQNKDTFIMNSHIGNQSGSMLAKAKGEANVHIQN